MRERPATTSSLAMVRNATRYEGRVAIIDRLGVHPYGDPLGASARVADVLLGERPDLLEEPVAVMVQPGVDYVRSCGESGGRVASRCPSVLNIRLLSSSTSFGTPEPARSCSMPCLRRP
ncbi:MAG: hypothetical protein P8Y15_08245 [Gemmatimonadales bacterium]